MKETRGAQRKEGGDMTITLNDGKGETQTLEVLTGEKLREGGVFCTYTYTVCMYKSLWEEERRM